MLSNETSGLEEGRQQAPLISDARDRLGQELGSTVQLLDQLLIGLLDRPNEVIGEWRSCHLADRDLG